MKRLDAQLNNAYRFADKKSAGGNVYIEEMGKNVKYAEVVANVWQPDLLRRTPPSTLLPSVIAYPEDLVID